MTDKPLNELADIRREYIQGGLSRSDLSQSPIDFFGRWFEQIKQTNASDPTAMVVATCDESGQPYQRTVLLKHFDETGFVFYTNLGSRKAQHIKNNNKVCLHFPWHMFERQVHITGEATPLEEHEVLTYFSSRPKESQMGAWASKQSQVISSREVLEERFFALKEKFKNQDIPHPTFWGGYRVKPQSIEFWQGGAYRLHDRFIYTSATDENTDDKQAKWHIERLSP